MTDQIPGDSYIDLDRRFRDLTDEEREDPNIIAVLSHLNSVAGSPWSELLVAQRVVLLAEAGSGKTRELQEQKRKLVADGKAAFFLPIEALDKESVADLLAGSPDDARRFREWLADGSATGWIFLDAVDELKLVSGKHEAALRKVAAALGEAVARSRIIVSCRPTDWDPIRDLEALRKVLPASDPHQEEQEDVDELFLRPLQDRPRKERNVQPTPSAVRIVVLQPLDRERIRRFAEASGVKDAANLLAAIDRQEAWTFARRPLDLKGLAEFWKQHHRLGSRKEQHEIDIQLSLRERRDRPDEGKMSWEKAVDGAERLALALALTKTRTLKEDDQTVPGSTDASVLDPVPVLADWKPEDVRSVLRRPLFDPATYGRVRFHHRSVQEFLAAKRLFKMRQAGMAKKALFALLFSTTYGEKVLIPSMRPIAAWLALWDDDVRVEILKREPEVLVDLGDAASLSAAARADLVRYFAATYGPGDWRGLSLSITELQRLAHSDLSGVIRSAWDAKPENDEVRVFLMKLVWLGGIADCLDIALDAALDPKESVYLRTVAVRALGEGKANSLRQVSEANHLMLRRSHRDKGVLLGDVDEPGHLMIEGRHPARCEGPLLALDGTTAASPSSLLCSFDHSASPGALTGPAVRPE